MTSLNRYYQAARLPSEAPGSLASLWHQLRVWWSRRPQLGPCPICGQLDWARPGENWVCSEECYQSWLAQSYDEIPF